MHVAVTLMSLGIKSMAVRILIEHSLKLGGTRQAQNQIKPTRYCSLCSLLESADAFSLSVRIGWRIFIYLYIFILGFFLL